MIDKFKFGFTLIEIIVVISLIGILATVAIVSFQEPRADARDKIRASDLKQLQLALEQYRAVHGRYPEAGCDTQPWSSAEPASGDACFDADYIAGTAGRPFVPDFIATLPRDPRPIATDGSTINVGYQYRVDGAGHQAYKLIAYRTVEQQMVTSYADALARCPSGCGTDACPNAGPLPDTYGVYGRVSATAPSPTCW